MTRHMLVLMLMIPATLLGQDRGSLPLPAPGNVSLPLDEYNRLVELAGRSAKKADVAPLPFVIKRADLKLRATSDSALGTLQLEGEVLSKGPAKVPLANGLTVLDARQSGKALPFAQEGAVHTAILSGPAEFSVELDIGIPLNIEAGRAAFNLPAPASGTVRLSLEIPGDHTNVRLSPGLITARTSDNGRTLVEATLASGQVAGISWATREIAGPAVPREVRFLSDVKSLVSVGEADLRLTALSDITVVQGEPTQFEVEIPAGYELRGVTGASVESAEVQNTALTLKVIGSARRSHQFLISLERSIGDTKADVPFLSFKGAQRETGEVLVEGAGTMELAATEGGALRRMDLKETNAYLRSLARFPLHAAFRYHRQPAETPRLALTWNRFPEGSMLAAVAERAVMTTLVTSEGRSLTEIKLILKNQAQPFLKVALPAGASIVSADVAGEKVKPVQGTDGSRVPLMRTGFRPSGTYTVTFVIMHAGAPFAKKGDSELSLPKMDLPISLLQWEVFLPELYKVKDFGGDVISTSLLPPASQTAVLGGEAERAALERAGAWAVTGEFAINQLLPGQLGGVIVDPAGSVIPGAKVTVAHSESGTTIPTITDESGRWLVSGLPSGQVKITAESPGFSRTVVRDLAYGASRPSRYNMALNVANVTETVTVSASTAETHESQQIERNLKRKGAALDNAASSNVINLQKRVAGVLPIRVDVPRAGMSYRFVRPLVLDEETKVTFSYKTR
ncbi:MAG TPA: carboxypeptidase-like regulatory domain-containing protein [Acidobacteriota bacterium]|nr:carboxypeptidase-like regulatory domain-containing protein [Acidobacteriota bacterium]